MKAVQFSAPNVVAVAELDDVRPQADEVLLASRVVGICHSDVVLLEGNYIKPVTFPVTPGHEWSAEVLEVGTDVTGFQPGDRVVGECVIGDEHRGFTIDGAAAEYFVSKPASLHKIPETLSWTQGALVEPFSVAYYGTLVADNLDASDTVVVLGAGPIGLCTVAAAIAKGARVIVAGGAARRLAIAVELGAETAPDPRTPEFLGYILDVTQGRGPSVVIEASGKPAAMATALEVAGFRARVVVMGIDIGSEVSAQLGLIQSKELQIRGTIGSPNVWPQTIAFLSQSGIDLSPLVTSTIPLDEGGRAFDTVLNDPSQVKVHMFSSSN